MTNGPTRRKSAYVMRANDPNASALQSEFVNETSDVLCRVTTNESTILLSNFNAHVWNGAGVWKGVIGRHDDTDINDNGKILL